MTYGASLLGARRDVAVNGRTGRRTLPAHCPKKTNRPDEPGGSSRQVLQSVLFSEPCRFYFRRRRAARAARPAPIASMVAGSGTGLPSIVKACCQPAPSGCQVVPESRLK